jgi:predicted O-methyltransferase YrrM
LSESPLNDKIDFRIANAIELIPQLDEEFDIVFIDADKLNYINYYHLVFDKVKKGGYILADNVLWSGKVTGDYEKSDKDTRLLMDFNKLIQEDDRVENVLLPIRDGIMIARKR